MPICIEVWGGYACFSRPEMKVERVSYDIMTPSAARGLIESIYWHPGIRWVVDRIHVLAPIRFTNIRRNEVKSTISARPVRTVMERGQGELYLVTSQDIQQRASLLLRDVRYVIEAHFDILPEKATAGDNPGKFQDIVTRRIAKGQFYHQPCFGCREFPAHFAPCQTIPSSPEELRGERDLGYMLYDMDYTDPKNIRPLFFRAVLRDGVLHVPPRNSEEVRG
ncbi:MAG: type I-C CRISPR-associated protein Cas5c [Oscillospiraceae bacterium]|nr:type I-C CRISPR-associated protein Cas5c [Oscillospiraceae bacterium]